MKTSNPGGQLNSAKPTLYKTIGFGSREYTTTVLPEQEIGTQKIMDPYNDQMSYSSQDTGYWTSDTESEVDSMEAQWGSDNEQ